MAKGLSRLLMAVALVAALPACDQLMNQGDKDGGTDDPSIGDLKGSCTAGMPTICTDYFGGLVVGVALEAYKDECPQGKWSESACPSAGEVAVCTANTSALAGDAGTAAPNLTVKTHYYDNTAAMGGSVACAQAKGTWSGPQASTDGGTDCTDIAGTYKFIGHCVSTQIGTTSTLGQAGCALTLDNADSSHFTGSMSGSAVVLNGTCGPNACTCTGAMVLNVATMTCNGPAMTSPCNIQMQKQ